MKFWIFINRELSELQSDFEIIFGVNNLYHDYENVWEWLESVDRKSNFYLNISRIHNWERGEYNEPIMIIVESNIGDILNESEIALSIKKQLNCHVFAGQIQVDEKDKALIIEQRKY